MKFGILEAELWERRYLEKKLAGNELVFEKEPLTVDNVEKFQDCEAVSIFICSTINKDVLDKMPQLKFVTTRSTGFDHIDLNVCKEKGVIACNVPHYGTHTVAEHAFALILGLSRKLYTSVDRTRRGDFDHHELTGFDLYDKTIGIIGMGDIGLSVINIAKGFGMHVVVYSRHPSEEEAKKLGITFMDFKEVLKVSDVVTLHVPYTKETHHLINKRTIKKFKKGSLLINTARGGLIQTEALLYGLEKGILGGAGIDVLEGENAIQEERQILDNHSLDNASFKTLYFDHVLMGRENVIITPHNAFNSREALHLILDVTAENLLAFQQEKPQNTLGDSRT